MKKIALLSFCMLVLGSGSAVAGIIDTGPIILGNSWSQGFYETGIGFFNMMNVQMISGGPFEVPTFSSFRDSTLAGTWTSNSSPNATANGSAVDYLTFNLNFEGVSATPLTFNFAAFSDQVLREYAHAVWNGNTWTITGLPLADYTPPMNVPEPGLALLLGIGFGVVSSVACRFRR